MNGELNYSITFKPPAQVGGGFKLATNPVFTHSTINRDRFTIPGHDGDVLGVDEYRSNAYVNATFHCRAVQSFTGTTDNIEVCLDKFYRWAQGTGDLIISVSNGYGGWSSDGHYKVVNVVIVSEMRISRDYARVEVQFEIEPYRYYASGDVGITTSPIVNNYDVSKPLYELEFEGSSVVLTVNGNSMTVNKVPGYSKVFVDTEKQIAYATTSNEARVNGDYKKMYLLGGGTSNTVAVSSGTFKCYPRWGTKI